MAIDEQLIVQARRDLQTSMLVHALASADYNELVALPDHATLTGGVHGETKESVGLKHIINQPIATKDSVSEAIPSNKYSSPQSTGKQLTDTLRAKPFNNYKINNIFEQRANVTVKASETTAREIILAGDAVNLLFIKDIEQTPRHILVLEKPDAATQVSFTQNVMFDNLSTVNDFTAEGRYLVDVYQLTANDIVLKVTHIPYTDGLNLKTLTSEEDYKGSVYFGVLPLTDQSSSLNEDVLAVANPSQRNTVLNANPNWYVFNYWGRFFLVPDVAMLADVSWSNVQDVLGKPVSDIGRLTILSSLDQTKFNLNGSNLPETANSMFDIFFKGMTTNWYLETADKYGFGLPKGVEWTSGTVLTDHRSKLVRGSVTQPSFTGIKTVNKEADNSRYSFRPVIELVHR